MPAKNSAAFTLVFVTVVNYIIYNRAISQGTIVWGKIDFVSQFVLVFLAFSAIWTMGLMGAVRSLLRKYFHTYNLLPDFTPESFTPTLSYSAWWITAITVVFYVVVSFAILVTLRPSEAKSACARRQPCACRSEIGQMRHPLVRGKRNVMGNVIKKLVVGLIVGAVLLGMTKALEFPMVFQGCSLPTPCWAPPCSLSWTAPSLKPLGGVKAVGALVVFYVVLCVVYIAGASLWPQYDPEDEKGKIEKILKPKRAATEQGKAEELIARAKALDEKAKALAARIQGPGRRSSSCSADGWRSWRASVHDRRRQRRRPQDRRGAVATSGMLQLPQVRGEGGKKRGPELDNIGNLLTVDEIKQKILDPKSWMAEGFEKEFEKGKMPDKYKDLMEETGRRSPWPPGSSHSRTRRSIRRSRSRRNKRCNRSSSQRFAARTGRSAKSTRSSWIRSPSRSATSSCR